MKTTQKIMTILVTVVVAFVLTLGANAQQAKAKAWPVPDKDKAMKSPVNLKDQSVIDQGKELWAKNCKSCHGAKGLGDGPKSAALKTFPGDFTAAAFQGFTDGELHFRTVTGRDEMPAYGKKIPDVNEQWALVAFMRTFKK
jgi:mono/diheme cytochrome c family protein